MDYLKTKSRSTMRGEWYEVKVAALLYLRSRNSNWVSRFQLATNVKGAGALDDIVYRMVTTDNPHEWHTSFIQLKHKDRTPLRMGAFTGSGGDFALKKYLKSFIDIKKAKHDDGCKNKVFFEGSFDLFEFIIYTNSKVENEIMKRKANPELFEDSSLKTREIEKLLKTNEDHEMIFTFNRESDEAIFSFLEENGETRADVSEFLEKLTVFSGQPTESELDDFIKKELVIGCGGAVSDAGPIYRIFEGLLKQWWRDSDIILDETSDILQRAIDQLSSEADLTKQTEQCTLDVNFDENLWDNFNTSFSEDVSLLHVITTGLSLRLSATKVLRLLHAEKLSFTFIGLDYLLRHRCVLISDWQVGYKDCLVIVCDSQEESDDQDALDSLSVDIDRVLQSNSNKKTVLVSQKICSLATYLKGRLNVNKYKLLDGTFDITDLNQDTKSKLFGIEVSLQDHKMTLESLLDGDINFQKTFLSDNLVETLLSRDLVSIGASLPNVIQHFIPRRLKRHSCLKAAILKSETSTDVFAVSGVTFEELQQFVDQLDVEEEPACDRLIPHDNTGRRSRNSVAPKGTVGRAADLTTRSRFLVLAAGKAVEEYNRLCQTQSNVHWLQMEHQFLQWMKSKGSIATIVKYIDEGRDVVVQSEDVLDVDSKVILVIAEPGMGKTTLLPSLAQSIKRANPSDWIIQINLREQSELFNQSPQLSADDFLTSALGINSPLEQTFLRVGLEVTGNIVVMLDSFDEICPRYEEEGRALLTSILKTRVKKVVVTSRHCMQDMLEDHLSTLAYNIIEFSENDQKTFFRKFWSQFTTPMTSDELEEFITRLLDSVNAIDPGKRLMGIPLQTMMLAEVFHDHVMDPKNNKFPQKLDMINLFEQFVDKKFMIFFRKGYRNLNKTDSQKKFVEDHMHAALMLLVNGSNTIENLHSDQNIVVNANSFLMNTEQVKENSGIVINVINHKPKFLHQMFAEYFTGLWFAEHYHSNRPFFKDYLFHANYKVIRSMFDRIVSQGHKLHEAVLDKDILLLESLLTVEGLDVNAMDKGGRTALHLAASLGFEVIFVHHINARFIGPRPRHMVELLLEHGADVNVTDAVLQWTPLEYAHKTMSWDAMEYLLENQADTSSPILSKTFVEDWEFLTVVFRNRFYRILTLLLHQGLPVNYSLYDQSLLHHASRYGYLEFVELLLSKGANKRARDYMALNVPLHIASRFSHLSIVQALVKNNSKVTISTIFHSKYKFPWFRKYVNTRNAYEKSALHYANNSRVVELLISCGACIWVRDKGGKTCLHSACEQNYLPVVQVLIENLQHDQRAVIKFINAKDNDGNSALVLAAMNGHLELVRLLISYGANVSQSDRMDRTCLHRACLYNKMSIFQALIESLGQDRDSIVKFINAQDSDGSSAMSIASEMGRSDIVRLLLSCGADIWSRDKWGRTCLHWACENNNFYVAQILLESLGGVRDAVDEFVNAKDNEGSSATAVASEKGRLDVVSFLISYGADIWARDKMGRTCLHGASMFNRLSIVEVLIESVGPDRDTVVNYVNILDGEGKTASALASEKGYSDVVRVLISHDAIVFLKDKSEIESNEPVCKELMR